MNNDRIPVDDEQPEVRIDGLSMSAAAWMVALDDELNKEIRLINEHYEDACARVLDGRPQRWIEDQYTKQHNTQARVS